MDQENPTQNQPQPDQQPVPLPGLAPKPVRPSRKKWLVAAAIVLAAGVIAGLTAYLLQGKDKPVAQDSNTVEGALADEEILTSAGSSIFFQLDKKIIAYDTAKKSPKTLYENLPPGSEVESLYVGADGWRAYYVQHTKGDGTKIFYIENGTANEIITSQELGPVTADAKLKLAAYSLLPIIYSEDESEMTGDANTTRTYLVKAAGAPELVFKSEAFGDSTSTPTNTNGALYNVREIAPDGNKLLFGRSGCYYCDGGDTGDYAEFDIASKKMMNVPINSTANDLILSYNRQGDTRFYLHEYPDSIYSGVDGPGQFNGFNLKVSRFTDPAKKTLIFQEKNDSWNVIPPFSPDYSLLAIEEFKPGNDYNSRFFRGLYEIKGTSAANLSQLSFTLPEGTLVSSISSRRGDCIGISTTVNNYDNFSAKFGAGVVCLDGQAYKLTQIAETAFIESNFAYAKVL